MNLSHAIDAFILAQKADGSKPQTIKWYQSNLRNYAKAVGAATPLTTITTTDLRQHIVDLQEQPTRYQNASQKPEQRGGLSPSSIEARKRALHSFFAWCANEYTIDNPMRGIKRKRYVPRPKSMHPSDFVKLFNATFETDSGIRDRAILAFTADTGCRRKGVIGLQMSELFMERRQAMVFEKGDNSRMVHFTHMTQRFLQQWLEARETDCDHVFVSMNSNDALSPSGFNQLLKRLKFRAGVKGRANPHSMRHQFARQYIMNGGDITTLARLLGHNDIRTTAEYYAIFTQSELAELHEKYTPMGGFNLDY